VNCFEGLVHPYDKRKGTLEKKTKNYSQLGIERKKASRHLWTASKTYDKKGTLFTTFHADFGAATHPGVGGGTHRRRATFDRC